ncbi:hypothetical protein NLI96_g11628 [Meripilus lineatus]|uniref:Protein kinase domain-containing protein n=1 Tax=Meripilus lineatus TaxID=2056292 RepID=A0AAD5URL1_9APHY|nr:hypothetical protein NLI96_g11628 [Physisporinus lineatus]
MEGTSPSTPVSFSRPLGQQEESTTTPLVERANRGPSASTAIPTSSPTAAAPSMVSSPTTVPQAVIAYSPTSPLPLTTVLAPTPDLPIVHSWIRCTLNEVARGTEAKQELDMLKNQDAEFALLSIHKVIEAFIREALVWCHLEHPNVLKLLGVCIPSDKPPLLISLPMENQTITKFLDGGPSRMALGLDLVRQIADGLDYLHGEKIVHGDLRGANILIDAEHKVKIADFGVAVLADSTLTGSHHEGNARWLCPIYLIGYIHRPDYACDMYAFGCVCVEIFASRHIVLYEFEESGEQFPKAAFYSRRMGEPTKNPQKPPTMSGELWETIRGCWRLPRTTRYESRELVERLSKITGENGPGEQAVSQM